MKTPKTIVKNITLFATYFAEPGVASTTQETINTC